MKRRVIPVLVALVAPAAAFGQPNGEAIYKVHCAACHDNPSTRAPARETLKLKSRTAVLASMVSGSMAALAKELTSAEKRAVADLLGAPPGTDAAAPPPDTALCPEDARLPGDPLAGPRWIGWGADSANTRYQPPAQAGLTADQVPKLKLKWAFGFPETITAYGQPAVAGGRLFVGSEKGAVYSLDAATGCAHWSYGAAAGVRTAISVGSIGTRHAVFFGDIGAKVYALDAATGERIWDVDVDPHPFARITGAPILHDGRIFVPVSSVEEVAGARPKYECCTFRGSVVALDAATGKTIWQRHMIGDAPKRVKKNPQGTQLWHPAGAAVWSSPTLDLKRQLIYVGTGNAYTEPAAPTSDAIVAIDVTTGAIRWVQQITPNDVFVVGCQPGNPNCPDDVGPDADFGSSPILRSLPGGKDILVVGQKSGVAYGLDPDRQGAIVWQFRAGKGGALGGIEWGMAADETNVYVPVSDVLLKPTEAGGLFALKLADGQKVWYAPPAPLACTTGRGCSGAQSAAITAIPGVVFSGSIDGHLRAYSTADGRVLWDFDTAREFPTVNGVKANGGSIDAPGPVVVGGMVFTNSGYGMWRGKPGNVLLAFEVEK
jgi:polyvinyl alcohol dehydrogenase (cytochrome)